MNKYVICYSSLETGDIIFLDNYSSLTEAQQRLTPVIKNYMADEESDTEFRIFDKKDFDFDTILQDDNFTKGVVYRIKINNAKVYKKTEEYECTSVVGYVKPVNAIKLIGKISIMELYINGVSASMGGKIPPPPRRAPKQSLGYMAELGNAIKTGVRLKPVRARRTDKIPTCMAEVGEEIIKFIDEMTE